MIKYFEGKSALHQLDPRVKIIWCLIISILVALTGDPIILGIIFLSTVLSWIIVHPPLRRCRRAFIFIIAAVITTMISQSFFYNAGSQEEKLLILSADFPILGKLTGGLFVSLEGLKYGFIQSFRLSSLFLTGLLIIMTTYPSDLILGLTRLGIPGRFAFMLTVSFRFLPVLEEKSKRILTAQRLRGMKTDGWISKIKVFRHLLVPLVIDVLRDVRQLALAAEVRCFTGERIPVKKLKFRSKDWIALGFLLLFSIFILIVPSR